MKLKKYDWGTYKITGPRHLFRENLMYETLRHHVSIKNISKMLEAGCGSASFSFKMLKNNNKLMSYGFDIEEGYSKIIKNYLKPLGLEKRFKFQAGTFEELPKLIIDNKPYELIVSGEVLEHIADDKNAIRQIFKLLDCNGYALVSVPQKMKYWSKSDVMAGHFRRYEKNKFITLFENEGFKTITVKHWGWPIVRLYHSFIYTPLRVNKKTRAMISEVKSQKHTLRNKIIYLAKLISFIFLYFAFQFDRIFAQFGIGHGLIVLYQKPAK